jgi:hypothetical protein
LAKKIKKA